MSSRKLATNQAGLEHPNTRENPTPRVRESPSTPPQERVCIGSPKRRTSAHIEVATAQDVRAALCHAIHIGLPPNRHLTINLEAAGVADPIAATGRFLKLLRDAARRHRKEISYIWVRETGPKIGDHVHVLLHVPGIPKWFVRRKPGWLRKSGLLPVRGGSRTRTIKGCAQDVLGDLKSPALYAANLKNLERYLMKHCSTEVQRVFGIGSRGPCLVIGKRVSISQNLHRAAQARCTICTPRPFHLGTRSQQHGGINTGRR